MGIKWKNFQMPKRLECDESSYTSIYGKFIAEPFERGYGVTLGNSLRRALLSSIEGSAVTSVKIDGISHEFSTISGVVEDVTDIILNIKQLIIRSHAKTPKTISIKVNKKGEVKAADIQTDEAVEILNPDLHIATLTQNTKFNVELEVGRGKGYVPAEANKKDGQAIGGIAVDSVFTPVLNVNFHVESTRVGQRTDYDRLIIEITTNGSISPKDALLYASNIFQRHLDVFVNFGQLPEDEEEEVSAPEDEALYDKLKLPTSEVELSVRSANCLKETNIKTIGALVKKTESDLLGLRNFGKKSLTEIKELIESMGLSFGMDVDLKRLKK